MRTKVPSSAPWLRLCVLLIILMAGWERSYAQPYYYFGRPLYSPDTVGTRIGLQGLHSEILKQDIKTGKITQFDTCNAPLDEVFWDPAQRWVFTVDGYNLTARSTADPTRQKVLASGVFGASARVMGYQRQAGRIILEYVWGNDAESEVLDYVYDSATLDIVDTLIARVALSPNPFLSSDESILYVESYDKSSQQQVLKAYSFASKTFLWTRELSAIGPPTKVKVVEDGKNGKALTGYNYPTTANEDNQFVVYDPASGQTTSPCAFPFRSHGMLSLDAKYILAQRVEFLSGREDTTGDVWVFDAASGKALQKLKLPPAGTIYLFDADTTHFYYRVNSTGAWIKCNVAATLHLRQAR